jgi:hypothetical protein
MNAALGGHMGKDVAAAAEEKSSTNLGEFGPQAGSECAIFGPNAVGDVEVLTGLQLQRAGDELLEVQVLMEDLDGAERYVRVTGFVDVEADSTVVLSPSGLDGYRHSLCMDALEQESRERRVERQRAADLRDALIGIGGGF